MKKYFWSAILLLGLNLCVFVACSTMHVSGSEDELTGNAQTLSALDLPVRLFYARAESEFTPQSMTALAYLYGYIEVENLAYEKSVVVHYSVGNSGVWQDVNAQYIQALPDNKELWYFKTPKVSYSARLSGDFQFALRYSVNGEDYWDNNEYEDYKISTGSRPLWTEGIILGKSALALYKLQRNGWGGVYGNVKLKNLAYEKVVKVFYTLDGWQNIHSSDASYENTTGDNNELWGFNLPIGGYGYYPAFDFAILYQVNGWDIWDNNFNRNYHMVEGL